MTRPPCLLGRRVKTCSVTETQSLGMTTTLAGGHEDPKEASHKPRHQPRPAHVLCAQQGSQHFTHQLHDPQSSPGVGNAHPPHPTCGRRARRAASARRDQGGNFSVCTAASRNAAADASCSTEPLRAGWEEAAPAPHGGAGVTAQPRPPRPADSTPNRPHTGRPSADSHC